MVDYRLSEQPTASVDLVLGEVTTKIWVVFEILRAGLHEASTEARQVNK